MHEFYRTVSWVALAAAVVFAGPALGQNKLTTEPVVLRAGGDLIRLAVLNASDESILDYSGTCYVGPNNVEIASFSDPEIPAGIGTTFGFASATAGAVHCDFRYEGSCEGLRVSACALDGSTGAVVNCAEDGYRSCQRPELAAQQLATASVQSARFRRTHCAVTNVGEQGAGALAEIIDANGAVVATGQLGIEAGRTGELGFTPYVKTQLWCRITPLGNAALRARIYTEGLYNESTDGSAAR